MTEADLRKLLTAFESERVERTRSFNNLDKMGQAVCAFANDISASGEVGYLLLGVDDDGKIAGKRIDDERWTALGGLKTDGNLLPPPSISMEKFSLDEGDVIAIKVFPSAYPPIRYNGEVWIRVGPRKCKAREDDIRILTERRARFGTRDEELPCERAKMGDLDVELFTAFYLPRAIDAQVIEEDDRTTVEQMAALRFYSQDKNCPTNLGVLLFARHPEHFIPSAYVQYVKFAGADNAGDVLQENVFRGPLVKVVQDLDVFVKTGPAATRPVLTTAMREDPVSRYSAWALREFLMNAIIHRDYFLGNAPIKFYEYDESRMEISNPGGLYGRANPDNFPFVNDYRNPLLAEAMKVLGVVNKYNRGVTKANRELEKNGNPPAQFDVNKLTEFRVTVLARSESGQINLESGQMNPESGQINLESGQINLESGQINPESGQINLESGQINPESGQINQVKPYNTDAQDRAVLEVIRNNPGIKLDAIFLEIKTSTRSVRRVLERLSLSDKIEYRGSKRTGGWFVKT